MELFDEVKGKFTKNDVVIDEVIDTETDTDTTIENSEQPQAPKLEPATSTPEPETPTVSVGTGAYYVIIGSFRERANADEFLKQKQSVYSNAAYVGTSKSGYYMIGIGGYSREDAEKKRKEISNNAWIFIKKR